MNRNYSVMELTQSYFHLVQHSIAITIIEPKFRRQKPPIPLPPRMEPKRVVELFLGGAANPKVAPTNDVSSKRFSRVTKSLIFVTTLTLSTLTLSAQTTNASSNDTNQPPAANVVPSAPTSPATEPAPAAGPASVTNSVPPSCPTSVRFRWPSRQVIPNWPRSPRSPTTHTIPTHSTCKPASNSPQSATTR